MTAAISIQPRALAGAACALLLAGCSFSPRCSNEGQPYLEARDQPLLKAPPGMNPPNRAGGLDIPAAPSAAAQAATPPRAEGKCLDEAPSYFGTALSPLSSPEEVVAMWAQAWAERNTERMMSVYSQQFEPPAAGADGAAWLEQRREQVATGPAPAPGVQNLRVTQPQPDRRVVTFAQRFDGNTIRRELTLVRENGFWRILAERVLDLE